MLITLGLIIVIFVMVIATTIDKDRYFWCLSFALIALFLLMQFLVTWAIYDAAKIKTIESGIIPLVALNDQFNLEGSFFLSSGHIGECPIYAAYIIKTDEAGQEYKELRIFKSNPNLANNIRVYEDETENPYVDIKTTEVGSFWTTWIKIPTIVGYKFHIPPGSVTQIIQLDLEK